MPIFAIISVIFINILVNFFPGVRVKFLQRCFIATCVISTILSCFLFGIVSNLGALFLLLSGLTFIFVALETGTSSPKNIGGYINLMLLTYLSLLGCFISRDLMSFYVFFEVSIIPMFFIILLWGGKEKVLAAKRFFIYTIFGSIFIIIPIIYLYTVAQSFIPQEIASNNAFITMPSGVKIALAASMIIGFCVKLPAVPFHTWLPLAHVQAPTGGSMILAGILIKLGGYGIIQYVMPIFPAEMLALQDVFIIIAIISMVYASFVAMGQKDIKKMIAYSSVAHMAYVLCGIFSMNSLGINGAIFQMISHGIVSAGLFYMIGLVYSRTHTRNIEDYGNLYEISPFYAKFFLLLTMASVGLPGAIGFVGEVLTILSLAKVSIIYMILLASGCVFGAVYMLHLARKLLFGEKFNGDSSLITPMNSYEKVCLYSLGFFVIFLGIYPNVILNLL